jgi:hypothetical protein
VVGTDREREPVSGTFVPFGWLRHASSIEVNRFDTHDFAGWSKLDSELKGSIAAARRKSAL